MPCSAAVRSDTARALLARAARAQVEGRAPSTSVGLVRDGALVWHAGRGTLDGSGDGATAAPDTQYRIGSITKPFTAALVMQLRDEGRLDLDDRLGNHVDGTAFGDVRIRDLLAHAAGLAAEPPGSWWEREPGIPWADLAARFDAGLQLDGPGRFHYSNVGYAMLGELVARLRGMPWYDALRAYLLDPLGMRRTTYGPEEPYARGIAVHPFADVIMAEAVQDHVAMAPAGQLWSTVGDLARWGAFLCGDTGGVLARETVVEMRQPQVLAQEVPFDGYGLGLQVFHGGDRELVGHGGSVPGFLASLVVDIEARVAVIELANATAGRPFCGTDLLAILEQHEPTVSSPWTPVSGAPIDWADLVGLWHWGPAAFHVRLLGADRLELGPADGAGRTSSFVLRDSRWVGTSGYWAGEPLSLVRRRDGSVSHLDVGTFVLTRQAYDPDAPIPGGVPPAPWHGA
jgi:CubicO group peptidase (beta-lactamase class C family)